MNENELKNICDSIVRFLYDNPDANKLSSVDLYNQWSHYSSVTVTSDKTAMWVFRFLQEFVNTPRYIIVEAIQGGNLC